MLYSEGQSTLRMSQKLPGTILCFFYCIQELLRRAMHGLVQSIKHKQKNRIVPDNYWHVLSVDWPKKNRCCKFC